MFILCLSEGVSVGVGTGLVWECALVSSLGSSFFVLHLQCFFSECVSVGVGAGVGVGVGVGVREFSRFLCVFGLLLQNFSFVHLIAISSVFLIVVCGV